MHHRHELVNLRCRPRFHRRAAHFQLRSLRAAHPSPARRDASNPRLARHASSPSRAFNVTDPYLLITCHLLHKAGRSIRPAGRAAPSQFTLPTHHLHCHITAFYIITFLILISFRSTDASHRHTTAFYITLHFIIIFHSTTAFCATIDLLPFIITFQFSIFSLLTFAVLITALPIITSHAIAIGCYVAAFHSRVHAALRCDAELLPRALPATFESFTCHTRWPDDHAVSALRDAAA